MVKKDLVNRLALYFPDFRKRDLEYLVDLLFEKLTLSLIEGNRIEIRGFGRFFLRQQRERIFTNPKTKEVRKLPPRKRIIFKPGKDIKERLNQPLYGALDLGSQTFRLLIGKPGPQGLRMLVRRRHNVRLAEGLAQSGQLSSQAIKRGLESLAELVNEMSRLSVKQYIAAGTAALREASNACLFIEKAEKELGIKIEVFSPEQEAKTTFLGVKEALAHNDEPILIVDVGGGSTEFILGKDQNISQWKSLPIGAVRLRDQFLAHDPPLEGEINQVEEFLKEELEAHLFPFRGAKILVGTGGTVSCLAGLDLGLETYCPERTHAYQLKIDDLKSMVQKLAILSTKERLLLKGMEAGREDIILPGLLIFTTVMDILNIPILTVSEVGFLEGLLWYLIKSSAELA